MLGKKSMAPWVPARTIEARYKNMEATVMTSTQPIPEVTTAEAVNRCAFAKAGKITSRLPVIWK